MKFGVKLDGGDKWTVEATECTNFQAAYLINEINKLMSKNVKQFDELIRGIQADNADVVPDTGMILARWLKPGDVFEVDEGLHGTKRYICLEYVSDGGFVKAIREDVDKNCLGSDYRCVWQNIEDGGEEYEGCGFLLDYEEAKKYADVPGFVIDRDWWLKDRTVCMPDKEGEYKMFFYFATKNVPHCLRWGKTFEADKLVNRIKKA